MCYTLCVGPVMCKCVYVVCTQDVQKKMKKYRNPTEGMKRDSA